MNSKILKPNEFCAIVDRDGDVADLCSIHDDIIWSMIRIWDIREPDYAPHSPWVWDGSSWNEWK